MPDLYDPVYIIAVAFLIIGLQRMGSPKTAGSGILWAGIAMAGAVAVTFAIPGLSNIPLIAGAILIGGVLGWIAAARVAMVDMPQMVAIYNGMGAGAAAAIASIELMRHVISPYYLTLAAVGAAIGSVSIAGSVIAFLKLQGWMRQAPVTFRGQQALNLSVIALAAVSAVLYLLPENPLNHSTLFLILFFVLSIGYGFMMAIPIGGADMPVVIALFNAMTGIAVALDGFSIDNFAMVVAGILVGAAGTILTLAMARAMNRSMGNVLFGSFGSAQPAGKESDMPLKTADAVDVAVIVSYAGRVIIVPGYGMAASQAQFRVKELQDLIQARGIPVAYAIHPVAGRMPGHMNVLLAEAGVPYELMLDLDEANRDLPSADVALVIGANDVVNPAARDPESPLHGMPILNVDSARSIIVLKRGKGKGFAGVINRLFSNEKTRMYYGDASESISRLIQEMKKL